MMLTDIQQRKVEHLFNVLDSNKNGELQLIDFVDVCQEIIKNLGWDENARESQVLIKKTTRLFIQLLMDVNQPEMSLSFRDWYKFFEKEVEKNEGNGLLFYYIYRINHHLFNLFDLNNDNRIDFSEYANMLTVYKIPLKECRKSFDLLDRNGDSFISRSELIQGLDEYFRSPKEDAPGNWMFGDWR